MGKKTSLSILISLMLVSCAKADILPTPTTTTRTTVSPTSTPSPTKTPEATATASAVPTESGPKEGDTRTIELGGQKIEQVYTVIKGKDGEVMYSDWVREKTPGDGIPLQDFFTDEYLGYDQMGRIQLVCSDRFDGCAVVPKFTHVDVTVENPAGSVSGRVGSIIKDRLHINNLYDYQVSHPNGIDFNFFLTNPEQPLTWIMRPEPHSSVVEILTDWNDPILEGGQEYPISTSLTLRAKILGVDNAGRLIGVVALNELPPEGAEYDEWRADVWNAAIFLHSSMVLQQENLSNIPKLSVLRGIMHNAQIKSTAGNPWVIMEPDN